MNLESSPVLQRCNLCEKSKNNDKSFRLYFANCGHLICDECRDSEICPICDKKTNYVKLDDNLPENLKMFFQDPCPMIKLYSKVIEFQNLQSGIVKNQLRQQKKNHEQQIIQLQKDIKTKTKELNYFKTKCSALELQLQKRNEQLRALMEVNEKMNPNKKSFSIIDNEYQRKLDETRSAFFDASQINIKEVNDNKKLSCQDFKILARSLSPHHSNPAIKNYTKNKSNDNSKSKITYDSLENYLK